MSEPITTEQLDALVLAVDTAAEERGWTKRHLLVRVEAGTSDDDVQLGFKEIDGHPLDTLLGFTAPAEWLALGMCAEGWAASMDSGLRPSQSKGRMRMRNTALVTRGGKMAAGYRLAGGGEFELVPGGVGMIPDALKRALDVPTDPPEIPFVGWVARMLLLLIIGDGPRGHRRVPSSQLRPSIERHTAL